MVRVAAIRPTSWIHLALILGTVWMLGLVIRSAVHVAQVRADVEAVSREAREIHDALARFHQQNRRFPGIGGEKQLDRASLDPLRERGYYDGRLSDRLADFRVDAYVARDGRGENDEYWLEMSLARDPSVRFLVARSDDAPLGGGSWRDGAFVWRDGILEPL
jgi:hypothetical protein